MVSRLFDNIYYLGRKYNVKVRVSKEFQEAHRIANCAGYPKPWFSIGQTIGDVRTLLKRITERGALSTLFGYIAQIASLSTILLPIVWRYIVQHRSSTIFSKGTELAIEIEQIPSEKSYLFLDPSCPPETAPIGIHWGFDGREVDTAAAFCEVFKAEFEGRKLGTVEIDKRLLARDSAFLSSCRDSNHQMGGARMGLAPDVGVVDANLKVFGTSNLYVAGAAVFPSGSFANSTLTAIALAIRLAAHIKSDQGSE